MDIASFAGILRTIAILILIYYAAKFLLRLFAPMILQQVAKKAEQNFYQQQQYNQQQYNKSQQERNTNQQHKVKSDKKYNDNKKVGEYIDFEEID
ncbi:hypothetical protein GCM10007424_04390 [Flavobacterium suaedae]|uniref:DUF4834 family protein n=1 Tax=Flavobacterium suaedae TaxID=1767027 RepID=A0ABQ1JFE8_9FLAO|nr:DUF4834 family protein [Flavobacterium suaedae]GGB67568.1 hypothetical protein GCM10007424_04390 [Flavobacterium suaedae]